MIKSKYSLFILIILILFIGFNYFSIIERVINSNYINPLVTLIVGSTAYALYIKQQNDFKRDAANIILLEIENAQRMLKKASESLKIGSDRLEHVLPEKNFVLPSESWTKYRHLFVRELTKVEWESISDFYSKCQLFDQAVAYNDSFFQKDAEQIRENLHRVISDLIISSIKENTKDTNNSKEKEQASERINTTRQIIREKFFNMIIDPKIGIGYYPNKPINDAIFYISNLNLDLLLTSVGDKLRAISKSNK